jgi:hypothetical protein
MASTIKLAEVLQFLVGETKRLAARIDGVDYTNNNLPKRDPSNQYTASRIPSSLGYRLVSGSVVDAIGTTGWYSVQTDDNMYVACNALSEVSPTLIGTKKIGAIQAGCRVFVVINELLQNGTILGVIPVAPVPEAVRIHDYISQVSTNNMLFDTFLAHHDFRIPAAIQYETHAPLDETTSGEWGRITESGGAVFLDSFMAFLRADENCGFWAFWHDQLARMQGHNLQLRSPALDLYAFDDEDELSVIRGVATYLWEALGLFTPGKAAKLRSVEEINQVTNAEYALADLRDNAQTPFHRLRTFEGYLGQGFRKQLRLPPQNSSANTINTLTEPKTGPSVWEEHLSLDGNYHVVSSQGIFIAHAPVFQTPVQKKQPEDPTGDSRKSGYDRNKTKIKTGPDNNTKLEGNGMQWRSAHPFHYREKDWKIEEDTDQHAPTVPDFGSLRGIQYLGKSDTDKLDVDDREKQAEFYKTLSFLSILRDGTVVIAGPGGEEIRMGGGNVEISCPGDIQLRPGRSCVTLAGRDAIVRANKSVELSANTEDVRIKSDRNMQLLAGNSGVGGLLLESKSIGELQDYSKVGSEVVANGITFKSKSFVSCLGKDVYLRSYDAGSGFGQIIIDAAAGEGSIVTTSRDTANYNVAGLYQYFGPPDAPTGVNQYTDQISRLSGGLTCSYGVATYINGALVTKGQVAIIDGHVASTADQPFVGTIKGEALDQARAAFEELSQQEQSAKDQASDFYETSLTERIHGENRVGNEQVLKQMGFSFRTSDQYKAGNFTLFESRWAQVARATEQPSVYWQEKIVKANEQSTMPYPGFEAWTGKTGYCKVDNKLYTKSGPLPTGQIYEEAPSSESQKTAAENSYPVIA